MPHYVSERDVASREFLGNLRGHVVQCLAADGYPLRDPRELEYRPRLGAGNNAIIDLIRPFRGYILCQNDIPHRRIVMTVKELEIQLPNPGEPGGVQPSIGSVVDLPAAGTSPMVSLPSEPASQLSQEAFQQLVRLHQMGAISDATLAEAMGITPEQLQGPSSAMGGPPPPQQQPTEPNYRQIRFD